MEEQQPYDPNRSASDPYGQPSTAPAGYPPQPAAPQPYGAPPAYGAPPQYGTPPPYGAMPTMIQHAGLLKRFVALIIDGILLFMVQAGVGLVFDVSVMSMGTSTSPNLASAAYLGYLGLTIVIGLGYFIVLEGKKQQTIGKMAMKIIVVKEDLTPIDMRESLIRNGLRILYQIPCLGLLIYIIDAVLIAQDDQRIGDRVAHTFVIDKDFFEYVSSSGGMPVQPPMMEQPPAY